VSTLGHRHDKGFTNRPSRTWATNARAARRAARGAQRPHATLTAAMGTGTRTCGSLLPSFAVAADCRPNCARACVQAARVITP